MIGLRMARFIGVVTLTLVAVLGLGRPAIADNPPLDLPAGLACSFSLRIVIDGGNQVQKTFKDKNGVVRSISAGKGSTLTFTNLATGSTLSLKPNGSVNQTTTVTVDGSQTWVSTGHNVLILFPSDVPAVPRQRCTWAESSIRFLRPESTPCNRLADSRQTSAPHYPDPAQNTPKRKFG